MVSSYVAGITRVANILTVIVFVAEFARCEISELMTIAQFTFIQIMTIIRLTAIVLDILFTGTMIIVSIGMCIVFGLVVQYLLILVMLVQYLLNGTGTY